MFDENNKETIEQQQLKYQTLAAEIIAIGGLLQSSKEANRRKIIEEPSVLELMCITSHESTDPILLTAICRMALDLFETDEIKKDEKTMEPF